ncbi:MAG: DUF6492 family protein [Rhizobiaceae bacterium]
MTAARSVAIVTASYAPDFERCRLLCESIDRHVTGYTCHYLLVEAADVALFKALESPKRKVIDERELLPSWLKAYPDPMSLGRRRIWLSLKTPPLRGWHTQQLRRIAIAKHRAEDAFFYCDSDTAFVRNFDLSSVWMNDTLRLFRRDHALTKFKGSDDQMVWAHNAADVLGIESANIPDHDYIGTLIAWRRDTMLAMCDHIEKRSGKHWVAAVASPRRFSECMIYGQYADVVCAGAGHRIDRAELCQMFWLEPMPPRDEFIHTVRTMEAHKVAIGIQSFLGANIGDIKELIALAKA